MRRCGTCGSGWILGKLVERPKFDQNCFSCGYSTHHTEMTFVETKPLVIVPPEPSWRPSDG